MDVYISLNAGADFHSTGQSFHFYNNPMLIRTGCLGATKGCLTTGPTQGKNPVQVNGVGLNGFVDYVSARCRFSLTGSSLVFYDRVASYVDVALNGLPVLGAGLSNGSIVDDGSSLYCITPRADVNEKIVTQVAIALNGVDFVEGVGENAVTSQYSLYPQTLTSIEPVGGSFFESSSVTVRGLFFP